MSPSDIADAVVEAALAIPGVTALNAGRHGEVATYGVGRRITGVRLHEFSGEVHVEVNLSRNVLDIAEDVRVAVESVAERPMTVVVEDVSISDDTDTPGSKDDESASAI